MFSWRDIIVGLFDVSQRVTIYKVFKRELSRVLLYRELFFYGCFLESYLVFFFSESYFLKNLRVII